MSTDLRAVGFEEIKSRLTGMRLSVFDELRHYGPCTSTELSKKTGMSVLSLRPRICELRQMYCVRETGQRRDGEHEFEAISVKAAQLLHASARAETSKITTATEEAANPSPVFVDPKQTQFAI